MKINLFYWNEKTLSFKKIRLSVVLFIFLSLVFILSFIIGESLSKVYEKKITHEQAVIILRNIEKEEFKEIDVYDYLLKRRSPFPEILYIQAQLESAHFKSPLFISNNNCYGMKEPGRRITKSLGVKNGYADFESWKDCIDDRLFYEALYLKNIKSEEEYYHYLIHTGYAENMNEYVGKIQNMVENFKKTEEYKIRH